MNEYGALSRKKTQVFSEQNIEPGLRAPKVGDEGGSEVESQGEAEEDQGVEQLPIRDQYSGDHS